jgi:hypothetical protein
VFWISYKDLLRNYQHFDRTRLFGPEWTITQQWTSVDVPWSVDYLDIKFRIFIPSAGPVVIVLSQLDDRYFRGLEGQYDFHLQFRLHKDDEDEYIVRSNAAYYMKRSVSTELDLEPGVYWVLLKITAKRYPEIPTVADVVRNTCQSRREKLLSVGLSYDIAHAKGNFKELEASKLEKAKAQKKEKRKEMAKKMHFARTQERKKTKFRAMKREMKKQAKMIRRMAEEAEYRAREEAANEAARKLEEVKFTDSPSSGIPPVNGSAERTSSPRPVGPLDTSSLAYQSPPANGRSPSFSGQPRRRDTLTVQPPPSRHSTYPSLYMPDIRVHRPSITSGKLALSDISDDELSWDSELDAPDDISDSEMMAPIPLAGDDDDEEEGDDEFKRDPWNAVCVVGLRVYSKGQEVQIEVVRGDEEESVDINEDGEVSSPVIGRKRLDVDDAAKDAVEAVRTPLNSPISPAAVRSLNVGSLENSISDLR